MQSVFKKILLIYDAKKLKLKTFTYSYNFPDKYGFNTFIICYYGLPLITITYNLCECDGISNLVTDFSILKLIWDNLTIWH